MKFFAIFAFTFVLLGSTAVNAETVHLTCDFLFPQDQYTCQIAAALVLDNPNATFVIGGTHVEGFNNNDVKRLWITNSNIPFVISQLFATFPNLNWATINNGGLLRLQSYGFYDGQNLEQLRIHFNPNLQTIEPTAFAGLYKLLELEIVGNSVDTITASTFVGLTALQRLQVRNTRIQSIPHDTFISHSNLREVDFHANQLTTLDGLLFANNRQLVQITFTVNRIDSIGRGFIDGLNELRYADFSGNVCINNFWFINEASQLQMIREGLEPCFANA